MAMEMIIIAKEHFCMSLLPKMPTWANLEPIWSQSCTMTGGNDTLFTRGLADNYSPVA